MFRGIERQKDAKSIPLRNAVLCVDCEFVSDNRGSECAVCGGRSLFNIAEILGGATRGNKSTCSPKSNCSPKRENVSLFDVDMAIGWKQVGARDLSIVVEDIRSLIGREPSMLHIEVEPAVNGDSTFEIKAA